MNSTTLQILATWKSYAWHCAPERSQVALDCYAYAAKAEARTKTYGLTRRELEVISGVVAGMSNHEIASYFKIAEDTVKHHLSNIFDKLGVSKRLELAMFAVNHSLPLINIV